MRSRVFYTLFCGFFLAKGVSGQDPSLVLPFGHQSGLENIKLVYGESRLITTGGPEAFLWDLNTGVKLKMLDGHLDDILYLDVNQEKTAAVTTSKDGTAIIWNMSNGMIRKRLIGHKGWIYQARFSRDGKKIITASLDQTAKIWDTESGHLQHTLIGHNKSVVFADFSADSKLAITGSNDETARIWDTESGDMLMEMKGHTNEVKQAIFLPRQNKIVTCSSDNTARIWDTETGVCLKTLDAHTGEYGGIRKMALSPDGKYLVTCSDDSRAIIWDTDNWKEHFVLSGHTNTVKDAVFSADLSVIATASWDNTIRIWSMRSGNVIHTLSGHFSRVESIDISADGKTIVSASLDYTAKVWNAKTGTLVKDLGSHTFISKKGSVSPDGKRIVLASENFTAQVWDLEKMQLLFSLQGHEDEVVSAVYSPDGKKILTASLDKKAIEWEAEKGGKIKEFQGHSFELTYAVYSPDGKKIATCSHDRSVIIWDAYSGEKINTLDGRHVHGVISCAFSPDGKNIATVSLDNSIVIWKVNDGTVVHHLHGHTAEVYSIEYSPGGKQMATASRDKTIKIWDAEDGTLKKNLLGHEGSVSSVRYDPSGTRIVSASEDRTIRVWDVRSGEVTQKLKGHSGTVLYALFHPKAEKIISFSNDNTTRLWDIKAGNLVCTFALLDSIEYFSHTPAGYYQISPRAAKLLHYVTSSLNSINFEQLDVKYNRPDKVLEAIGNTDTALIRSYRKAWEKRIRKLGIDTTAFRDGYSVPEADFINREQIGYEQKNGFLKVRIKGRDISYPLDRFNIWVNESPLFGQRGISIKRKSTKELDTTISIPLSQGENRIECSITNVNGTESYRMPLYVHFSPAVQQKEQLRFIGIGIDRFSEKGHDLQYSVKDIRDLSAELSKRYGNDIRIDTLFNENVTAMNVKALKGDLVKTSVNDKVIIAYSGHGLLSKDYDYYLSTYSVQFDRPEVNGLPYDELENLLDSIPARRKLLLIDACHSGELDKEEMTRISAAADTLQQQGTKGGKPTYTGKTTVGMQNSFELMQNLFVNVGRSTGATVISAAAGTQFAQERGDLKNGVFTYCILETLQKKPSVPISELKKTVGERVQQLTNGLQKPTDRTAPIQSDWSL